MWAEPSQVMARSRSKTRRLPATRPTHAAGRSPSANLPSVLFAADIFARQASGANCYFSVSPIGSVDAGYNVDDDGTCGLSSANHSVSASSAIDDYLGILADNGGPTQTVALLNTPNPATSEADPALAVGAWQLRLAAGRRGPDCGVLGPRPAGAHTGSRNRLRRRRLPAAADDDEPHNLQRIGAAGGPGDLHRDGLSCARWRHGDVLG